MSSEPIRDPVGDHLLTPRNSAFVVIDYQPVQINSIASMERQDNYALNVLRGSCRPAPLRGPSSVVLTCWRNWWSGSSVENIQIFGDRQAWARPRWPLRRSIR